MCIRDSITAGSSKDYVYLIRETAGDNPSVTYDDTVIKATVTVTKDEHNKLSASVAYTVDGKPIDEASYENIYTLPEPTETELLVSKVLMDGDGQYINFGDSVFEFVVEPQDGAPAPENLTVSTSAIDAAEETMSFGKIQFTEDPGLKAGSEKVYTYLISEIVGDNPSVTYDTSKVTAEITVVKTQENKLEVTAVEYRDENGNILAQGEGQSPAVNNLYTAPEPVEVTFEMDKIYEGHELEGGDFMFELLDKDGNIIETVTNDQTGHVLFAPIKFSEDPQKGVLSYEYTVREVNAENPSVTYDADEITITVEITKTEENTLAAKVTYIKNGEDVTETQYFRNEYTAPEMTSALIELTKTYEGGILKGGDFSFILCDEEGNVIKVATNDKDGRIAFEPLNFTEDVEGKDGVNVYRYTVHEINKGGEFITYDDSTVTIEIRISKDADNKLVSQVIYLDEEGNEISNPGFVNTYTPPIEPHGPKTGDTAADSLVIYLMLMALSAAGMTGTAIRRRRKEKVREI